jgi:hypothetical protein
METFSSANGTMEELIQISLTAASDGNNKY